MLIRDLARWAMCGSAAIALLAGTVHAQVTPPPRDTTTRDTLRTTSTQRIPIRKESFGEVTMSSRMRADSIGRMDSIARADSITRASQARNDSIMAAERARTDSIMAAEQARTDAMVVTNADSIAAAARLDSIARMEQMRQDSIAMAEQARADSIARTDSPAAAALVIDDNPQGMTGGRASGASAFYWGLSGGAMTPSGTVRDLGYDNGYGFAVPIGWHNPASMFGFRLNLGYSQLNGGRFISNGTTPVTIDNPDPNIWSAEADVTVRFPLNENRTTAVYLVGGGGLYMFRNFGRGSALGGHLGNDVLDPDDDANESTINKWGWNGGAGLEFGIGRTALFLESRFVNVFAGRDGNTSFDNVFTSDSDDIRWIPLMLGVIIR
jgi:hypothetical protein